MAKIQSRHQEAKPFLVLDIGTEAVKVLVCNREDGKIIVSGSSCQYFEEADIFDIKEFLRDMLQKAIIRAMDEAAEVAKVRPDKVLVQLPPNVLKARILFQDFLRSIGKERISESEQRKIWQTVLDASKKEASRAFASESGILPQDIEFLNLGIIENKIDGYEVSDLLGYTGQNLSFRVLATLSPQFWFRNFQIIFKTLKLNIAAILHEVQGLKAAFPVENGLFLDVGGEITQLFLIKDGRLGGVTEFPVGGRVFSRELSHRLGFLENRARILKEGYSSGLLSEGVRGQIRNFLAAPLQEWLSNFRTVLQQQKGLLPTDIFLFGGGSLLPEIKEVLEEKYDTLPGFIAEPKVQILYPGSLKSIIDKTGKLRNPINIPGLLICHVQ